jgi:hypothetical protein
LICEGTEQASPFVLDLDGLGRSLPVFSFREEAELFLALDDLGGGWYVRQGGTGDFIPLLLGPTANLSSVVLDPLPMMLRDSVAGLISISPDRFMTRFLGVSDPGPSAG